MIVSKLYPNKAFSDHGELFDTIRAEKAILKARKKSVLKEADAHTMSYGLYAPELTLPTLSEEIKFESSKDFLNGFSVKSDTENITKLNVKHIINTTNLMDSHEDAHIPGLWGKTLKENRRPYLLEEHKMSFKTIIAGEGNVKAFTETRTWKELGAPWEGTTQALTFKSLIEKSRNEYMFDQYLKGLVNNHSVGMRYVKIFLAMNSESKWDTEEKDIWDKYIDQIANKETAEALGYFWAVTEAKMVEGSAVPMGSNWITPTESVEPKGAAETGTPEPRKQEPGDHSEKDRDENVFLKSF